MGLMAEPRATVQAESVGLLRDFGGWMTSEQRRVYRLCHRMLRDPEEADSATQDIFLKAYQALQRDDPKVIDEPSRWLTRIAVNTCLDRLRSKKWQIWRRRPDPEGARSSVRSGARSTTIVAPRCRMPIRNL